MNKLSVVTDVDGVLLDWFDGFDQWMINDKRVKVDHSTLPSMYDLTDKYHVTSEQIVGYITEFNSSEKFGHLKPVHGALEYFMPLLNDNSMVWRWLSSGSIKSKEIQCMANRYSNLQDAFGSGFVDGLLLPMRESKVPYLKHLQTTDDHLVFIEDSLSHAMEAVKLDIKTILLDYPYNQQDEDPKLLFRVENWKDASELLIKFSQEI